jgi:hypothetical protein
MNFFEISFNEMKSLVDKMSESDKEKLRREIEGTALRAAEIAAYIDYRQGHGASDQGHKSALKNLNRVGKLLWVKGFGYNGYHTISF